MIPLPDWVEKPLTALVDRFGIDGAVSRATVGGGFLRLRVSGARADRRFELTHPPLIRSIFETLDDHRRSGRAAWLKLVRTDFDRDGPAEDDRSG